MNGFWPNATILIFDNCERTFDLVSSFPKTILTSAFFIGTLKNIELMYLLFSNGMCHICHEIACWIFYSGRVRWREKTLVVNGCSRLLNPQSRSTHFLPSHWLRKKRCVTSTQSLILSSFFALKWTNCFLRLLTDKLQLPRWRTCLQTWKKNEIPSKDHFSSGKKILAHFGQVFDLGSLLSRASFFLFFSGPLFVSLSSSGIFLQFYKGHSLFGLDQNSGNAELSSSHENIAYGQCFMAAIQTNLSPTKSPRHFWRSLLKSQHAGKG